jgi:hypothetical protein
MEQSMVRLRMGFTGGARALHALHVSVLAIVLAVVLVQASAGGYGTSGSTPGAGDPGPLSGLPMGAQARISGALGNAASSYRVSAPSEGVAEARNPVQGLAAGFTRSGIELHSGGLRVGLRLRGIGYGSVPAPVDEIAPAVSANRVTYRHSSVSEWYVNGPLGLEQGFTVPSAPSGKAAGPLTLSLSVSGDVRVSMATGGGHLLLSHGASTLRYGELVARDAHGRTLPSRIEAGKRAIALRVDTSGASYPVRIDPLVQEGEKLTGGEEQGGALLGFSVALSADGNTALVGGPRDHEYAGAVWVFTRSGAEWTQQGPKLTGTTAGGTGGERCGEETGEEADECAAGRSVALSADGNTALVGSPREAGPCPRAGGECDNQGAVWMFARNGTTWSLRQTLTAGSEEGAEGRFGRAVALSADGTTALVGAPSDGGGGPGSAWVFTRSGSSSSWTLAGPKLTVSDTQGEAHLGGSVALSGDGETAVVGAPADNGYVGSAFVFARFGSSWHQVSKLTGEAESGAGHFGASVAVSTQGTTAIVGARADAEGNGAAWAFAQSGPATWSPQGSKLTAPEPAGADDGAEFGYSVALTADGNRALIGAPHDGGAAGAAWLFARSGSAWTQDGSKLTGAAAGRGWFGSSVALRSDGLTALVGAPNEASQASKEAKAGAVYVFADPTLLPLVEGLSPNSGPPAGGTTVRITGSRLSAASAVRFGSVRAASFTVNGDGSITAVSPPNPKGGAVYVTVTTPEDVSPQIPSALFTYVLPRGGRVFVPPPPGSGDPQGSLATPVAAGGVQGFTSGCTAALLSRSVPVLSKGRATVRLAWRGAGACTGKLTLSLKVRRGKKIRTRTIGTATFALSPGRARSVVIKLNAAGRALLRSRHGRLNASLRIVSVTSAKKVQAYSSTVHLAVPRRRR